ncbi:hypothetical protein Tco_1267938, partial [Tanacetum coccineum]
MVDFSQPKRSENNQPPSPKRELSSDKDVDDITATSVSTKRRQNEEAHDGGNIKEAEKRNMDIDESENFVLSRRTCGEKDGGHGTKDLRKKDSDGGEDSKEKTPSGGDQSDEKDYNKLINAEENDTDDDQSDKDSDEESNSNGGRDDDRDKSELDFRFNSGDENIYAKPDLVNKLNDDGLWEVYEQYDANGSSSKLNEGEDSKEKIHSGADQSDEKDYNKLINAEENGADDDQSDKDSDEESKSSGNTNGIQKEYGVGVVYPKINPFPSALRELVISTYHGMPHEPSHADDGESKTYFMYGASNEHVAVFKPMDGEAKGFVV